MKNITLAAICIAALSTATTYSSETKDKAKEPLAVVLTFRPSIQAKLETLQFYNRSAHDETLDTKTREGFSLFAKNLLNENPDLFYAVQARIEETRKKVSLSNK
ncbi:hypothetical protein KBB68_02725 [Candidatus Babeliales bacterium]|nr:hypothetical protein [Candidatus Babeliales bacterium]